MDGVLEPVAFASGALQLEGLLWRPDAPRPGAPGVVLCHPHPLYGGDMHNPLVSAIGRKLRGLGRPILRFNFRGSGMSEGEHDEGRGECDDVRAAVDFLTSPEGGGVTGVDFAGYSFGAWVGLRALGDDPRVGRLAAVAPPTGFLDMGDAGRSAKPKLVIHGTRDEFAPPPTLYAWLDGLPEPLTVETLEGADHFFFGFVTKVAERVEVFLTAPS